jgi:hypothetical protein
MNWENARLVHIAKVDNLRYNCEFIATNDDYVWKDTPSQKSVNACFYNDEDLAETIPYEQVHNISWSAIRIAPGYYAKFKDGDEHQVGDTPHEAVSYLEFEDVYSIDRPAITQENNIQDQVVDILRKLHGGVHYSTIPNYLNYTEIDQNSVSNNEIIDILEDLEKRTSIYKTTDSPMWWSAR